MNIILLFYIILRYNSFYFEGKTLDVIGSRKWQFHNKDSISCMVCGL